ncbi:GGDEF domain-containing protein [Vibrio sp. C8]
MALNALSHHPRLIKWVSVFSAAGIAFVFMINRQISFYDFVSLYSLPIDIAALYVIKSIDRDVNHKERDIGLILITLAIVLEFLSALVELFGGWWIAEQILEYRLPILSGTVGFFLVGLGFITSILTQDKLRIISQSQTDPLTNVLNRRGLEAHVQSLLFKRQDISLLLLDIDYFKNINDRYGHDFGDFVLKAFSELISQNIRQDDLFSRIGGEEFVLILPQTKPEFAIRVAEDLRQKIEQSEFEFQQQTLGITCSFGIAFCTQHFDFNLMVKQADMALYHAKNNGRNKVEVYQE